MPRQDNKGARSQRNWLRALLTVLDRSPPACRAVRFIRPVLAELLNLLVLLDDADPRIRTRIAYLLAWFRAGAHPREFYRR
ncbi:hypothetical protein ACFY9A_40055 [Streptomyces rubradiris]|uniref:hypothetical protein n=1 Tax=Streptomyces rubradiris TaxID=285531 RepID=UPI0036E5EDB9